MFLSTVKLKMGSYTWPHSQQFWDPWVLGLCWATALLPYLNSAESKTRDCSSTQMRLPGLGYVKAFGPFFFFSMWFFYFYYYYYQLQCGCTVKEMLVIFSSRNLNFHCSVSVFKEETKSKCSCQCIDIWLSKIGSDVLTLYFCVL